MTVVDPTIWSISSLVMTFDQYKASTLFHGASLKSSQEVVDSCQDSCASIAAMGISV